MAAATQTVPRMDEPRGTRARPGGSGTQRGGLKHTVTQQGGLKTQFRGSKHLIIVILAAANLARIQPCVLLLTLIAIYAACRQGSVLVRSPWFLVII